MMENRNALTKILVISGTILVWLPVLAPVFFSLALLFTRPFFRIDYLMPAELFPLVLVGALLLLWAALRMRKYRALIGWLLGAAVVLLVGGQAVAVLTGLANGTIEPTGWQAALVTGMIIGYDLLVLALGVAGLLLIRDLFRRQTVSEG